MKELLLMVGDGFILTLDPQYNKRQVKLKKNTEMYKQICQLTHLAGERDIFITLAPKGNSFRVIRAESS